MLISVYVYESMECWVGGAYRTLSYVPLVSFAQVPYCVEMIRRNSISSKALRFSTHLLQHRNNTADTKQGKRHHIGSQLLASSISFSSKIRPTVAVRRAFTDGPLPLTSTSLERRERLTASISPSMSTTMTCCHEQSSH